MHIDDFRRRLNRPKIPPTQVVGKCRYCQGEIVEKFGWRTEPFTAHTPIGPPLRSWPVSEGCHCSSCGLQYSFVPYDYLTEERKAEFDKRQAEQREALAYGLNSVLHRWDVELTPESAQAWYDFVAGLSEPPIPIADNEQSTDEVGRVLDSQRFIEDVAAQFLRLDFNWQRADKDAADRLCQMLETVVPPDKFFVRPPLVSNEWLLNCIDTRD